MKAIDLLIMRNKNEELPKEIVVKNETHYYKFIKVIGLYYVDEEGNYLFSDDYDWFNMLNYELEIIEDVPKIIEDNPKKIEHIELVPNPTDAPEITQIIILKSESCSIKKKINEIIDYINKGEDK